jgi:hypothetical protein
MAEVLTCGEDESPTHVYSHLRHHLEELFTGDHSVETRPANVALGGIAHQVISGKVRAPGFRIDQYELTCSRREITGEPWYETEFRDTEGKQLVKYVYTPDEGYRLGHDSVSVLCDQTYSSHLGIVQSTRFTPEIAEQAAMRALDESLFSV